MATILCPKCGTYNPPIESSTYTHYVEHCKAIIGKKSILFGLIQIDKTCNFIGAFDEDDDWHYCHKDKDGRIVLDKESAVYSIHALEKIKDNTEG